MAKNTIEAVIAHTIWFTNGQWLGILVTREWWSVDWLKEGFAFFKQYIGADIVIIAIPYQFYFLLYNFL